MNSNDSNKKMNVGSVFSTVNEDIMQNIFSRLPATSFASASCVSKSWNRACNRVLSKPKLASALSIDPSLNVAAKQVFEKVLSQPIRPHFVIACVGKRYSLRAAHKLVTKKFGAGVPIITNASSGIIGVDALTNELKEMKWEIVDLDEPNHLPPNLIDRGILLVVGYVPGLKVDAIPLLRRRRARLAGAQLDQFVMNITNFTSSVSDSTSPAGIILFGDHNIDVKPIIAKIDCCMAEETVVVGDASGCFLFRSNNISLNDETDPFFLEAVALVFAKDRNKPNDVGDIQFHMALSTGVVPFGPPLKAVCVVKKDSNLTLLTARVDGQAEILDIQRLLDDIIEQFLQESEEVHDFYIGVTKQRECFNGPESSVSFYEVLRGDDEFIIIGGVGIKPGDSFLFYYSDSESASSTTGNACRSLETFKTNPKDQNHIWNVAGNVDKKEVFGGFVFSCYLRGESFFGHPNVDTSPFSKNFPGVPLAGAFCAAEFGRGTSQSMIPGEADEDENSVRCCVHVYSTVFMVMSYVPPSLEAQVYSNFLEKVERNGGL